MTDRLLFGGMALVLLLVLALNLSGGRIYGSLIESDRVATPRRYWIAIAIQTAAIAVFIWFAAFGVGPPVAR